MCMRHVETTHADDRTMYQCQKCPRYFGMMQLKDFHEKYYPHPIKPYQCDICLRFFTSKKKIENHIERVHIGNIGISQIITVKKFQYCLFVCFLSSVVVFFAGTVERPFLCAECAKSFTSKRSLEHHLLLHGEPTIHCPSCPAKFYRQKLFELHFQWHQNLTFNCNECNYTCSIKSTLHNHISEF